jgi:hypothetical protein
MTKERLHLVPMRDARLPKGSRVCCVCKQPIGDDTWTADVHYRNRKIKNDQMVDCLEQPK